MEEKKVTVIKASDGPIIRDRRLAGTAVEIKRKRVAAYVRVSTNGEEQIQSFNSQKQYYQDKISQNKTWTMVGIYADEGITGTKTDKREQFLKMIDDCLDGLIDIVITKSESRFSRNLVDTLQYTRLLKQNGVTVIFEKENIDTSTMESEMQLSLLSALAQNEVESLSQNVKMGVQMKMSRGEMMGFNGCLGYDYDPETKSITINEEEAETVRLIYDLYLQGYGANTIARDLARRGRKNKRGGTTWTDSGVLGIVKNEKYKGDLLMGKTYTVDPISKRRLSNHGETNQYYTKDHHAAIVSEEIWEEAQKIRESRYRTNENVVDETRTMYTRKFAFSSMCQCGFCGRNLTRRIHNQNAREKKPVWKCRTATNMGIANCPHSKSMDEVIIENAFLDMMKLLCENFDDVLKNVLDTVENNMDCSNNEKKIAKMDKTLKDLTNKRKKLTDMLLEEKITQEAYDEKYAELTKKMAQAEEERDILKKESSYKISVDKRMKEIRDSIESANVFDKFDRFVFESIVDKIIIGEEGDNGVVDPYKITFILKGMDNQVIAAARNRYKNLVKKGKM